MTNRRVVVVAIALALAGCTTGRTRAGGGTQECRPIQLAHPRFPRAFFVDELAGLYLRGNCLYLLASATNTLTPIWRGRPSVFFWAPSGREIAGGSLLLDTRGRVLRRFHGRALAFFASGTLLVARANRLFTLHADGLHLAASAKRLDRAAGFRGWKLATSGTGGWTYGRGMVAVLLHRSAPFRERVLVVGENGALERASPLFEVPGEVDSAVGGVDWTPDGQTLFESNTRPSTSHFEHEHCLDRWSRRSGYQRIFCVRRPRPRTAGHWVRLVWAADGRTALLSNGYLVDRRGHLLSRIVRGPNSAFAIAWVRPRR
jgi:hypothetical protein